MTVNCYYWETEFKSGVSHGLLRSHDLLSSCREENGFAFLLLVLPCRPSAVSAGGRRGGGLAFSPSGLETGLSGLGTARTRLENGRTVGLPGLLWDA